MKVSSFALSLVVGCLVYPASAQPNYIVLQPDDLAFFEEWLPPAHFPKKGSSTDFPPDGLPNIERLRTQGLEMRQAYTASAMCGTSRYSTMTGRYPSRSSYGRKKNSGKEVAGVSIPTTKLEDLRRVHDGNDCSAHNLAALFSQNYYHTGVVGKWHLYSGGKGEYSYAGVQEQVRRCGFGFAEAIYPENMGGSWHDGTFGHNMEYVTAKGIEFIQESKAMGKPFFLYLNPTIPHGSSNVYESLTKFNCTDTPEGHVELPPIKGMTEGKTCAEYRNTVIERAGGSQDNYRLGSVWLDDAVGAVIRALEDNGELDNTFFLFQMDHGQEGKGTLYEPGLRIAQFIHFPKEFGTEGMTFDGLVSTIDIAPTMLEYAGIGFDSTGFYEMDGESWKSAVEDTTVGSTWKENRCLDFELGFDRAFRCGCAKYMYRYGNSTSSKDIKKGVAVDEEVLFNVCDANGDYVTTGNVSPETTDIKDLEEEALQNMRVLKDCHLAKTKPDLYPMYFPCTTTGVTLSLEILPATTTTTTTTRNNNRKNRTNKRERRKKKRNRKKKNRTGQT